MGFPDLSDTQLAKLAKNDSSKQALAWLVRSRTNAANAWVAKELDMGHVANESRAMKRMRENDDQEARRLRKELGAVIKLQGLRLTPFRALQTDQ